MNRRERLLATLQGDAVDRPAVSFYEINGLDEKPCGDDPFNIYSHASWEALVRLARERTDRIVMRRVPFVNAAGDPMAEFTTTQSWIENGCRYELTRIQAGKRALRQITRRDPDVNTVWVVEHFLKDETDLEAFLQLPACPYGGQPDIAGVLNAEKELGDSGIVMIDTPDPLCLSAALFDLSVYTVLATQQPSLFRCLLDRFAALLQPQTDAVARALPGRLWRIYGPEYASPPYLHPRLFDEFVTSYDRPMVAAIQAQGGFARIHSHGRLRLILDKIASTGCSGLDPIEPPPQGDMQLGVVRARYGEQMVLFGNLEASDLENLPAEEFRKKISQALKEGTAGTGRGFVLMASACPYGRILSKRANRNYELMVEMVEMF